MDIVGKPAPYPLLNVAPARSSLRQFSVHPRGAHTHAPIRKCRRQPAATAAWPNSRVEPFGLEHNKKKTHTTKQQQHSPVIRRRGSWRNAHGHQEPERLMPVMRETWTYNLARINRLPARAHRSPTLVSVWLVCFVSRGGCMCDAGVMSQWCQDKWRLIISKTTYNGWWKPHPVLVWSQVIR